VGEAFSLGNLFGAAEIWVGFVLTLLIASLLFRDNGAARFAQHLLVGVSLGYAAVAAIQLVLRPRLFAPLLQGEMHSGWLWTPFLLGLVLMVAGIERSLRQGRTPAAESSRGRRLWSLVAATPAALLLGIAVAAGLVGVVQGTIAPLFWQAAVAGLWWTTSSAGVWEGALALLLTLATLATLMFDPRRHVARWPRLLGMVAFGLIWLGQRAFWLAAGMVFARLFASRLTLLIDRANYLLISLQQTGLQQWLESIWLNMTQ
jgi:hypothetical protein